MLGVGGPWGRRGPSPSRLACIAGSATGCPAGPWLPGELVTATLKGLIESTYYLNGCEACFLGRCLAAVLGIEGETQHRDCRDD